MIKKFLLALGLLALLSDGSYALMPRGAATPGTTPPVTCSGLARCAGLLSDNANDISSTARSPTVPTIGAWEIPQVSGDVLVACLAGMSPGSLKDSSTCAGAGTNTTMNSVAYASVTSPPAPLTYNAGIAGALGNLSGGVASWSGGVYANKQKQMIVGIAGGHNSYSGSELYGYDLPTLNWKRLNDPSAVASTSSLNVGLLGYANITYTQGAGNVAIVNYTGSNLSAGFWFSLNTNNTFPTGVTNTIPYCVLSDSNLTANTFDFSTTCGGSPVTITTTGVGTQVISSTVIPGTPTVAYWNAHGLASGTPVWIGGNAGSSTGLTGISSTTVYYVLSAGLTSSSFEFSATLGGSPIVAGGAPTEPVQVVSGQGAGSCATGFWPATTSPSGPTGPVPLHTYDTWHYYPPTNQIALGSSYGSDYCDTFYKNIVAYNFTTKAWSTTYDYQGQYGCADTDMVTKYDPIYSRVYFITGLCYSAVPGYYDYAKNTFVTFPLGGYTNDYHVIGAEQPGVVEALESDSECGGGIACVALLNIKNGAVTHPAMSGPIDCISYAGANGAGGFDWDPDDNPDYGGEFIAILPGTNDVCVMTIINGTPTWQTLTFTGAALPAEPSGYEGVYGRFRYIHEYNASGHGAFAYISGAQNTVWIGKMP